MNEHDLGRKFVSDLRSMFPRMGVSIKEDFKSKLMQRKSGDLRIDDNGQELKIDAKAEILQSENFPIELMQDWQSHDLGWFYTLSDCDEIWYGRYIQNSMDLSSIHRINVRGLHDIPSEIQKKWRTTKTDRGHGSTILLLAPLRDLISMRVARCVFPT